MSASPRQSGARSLQKTGGPSPRLVSLPAAVGTATYSGRDALLKRSPDGQAAVVEVADELRVDGAAELSHLPVSRGDEDALDGLHENVVEQGVLRS